MFTLRQSAVFQHGTNPDGRPLDPHEREAIMKSLLPDTPSGSSPSESIAASPYPSRSTSRLRSTTNMADSKPAPSKRPKRTAAPAKPRRKPIRTALRHGLYVFVYGVIHFIFSVWLRVRKACRALMHRFYAIGLYHHRTPELIRNDIKNMRKLPDHVSVVLKLNEDEDRRARLKALVKEAAEVTAWCASSGIPVLSVYEKTGILKHIIPQIHPLIQQTLQGYFSAENCPRLSIRAPNEPAFSPPTTPPNGADASHHPFQITLLLISADDGRSTMVDLTKVLAGMAQKGKLAPGDINANVVDGELKEIVMDEPDLLVLFGPSVCLDGYPPWQVRLTEIL